MKIRAQMLSARLGDYARGIIRRVWETAFHSLTKAAATGSRGTVMKDARWILAMSLLGLLASTQYAQSAWVTGLFGAFSVAAFILNCGAYVYSLLKAPDSLRSETFTLEKMKLERGLVGDSISGLSEGSAGHAISVLPGITTEDSRRG